MSEIRLKGMVLSPGIGYGRACFYRQTALTEKASADVAGEEGRLHDALAWMVERLEALAEEAENRLDEQTADVFRAHRLILEDPVLRQRLFEAIENEGLNAEHAVERQLDLYQAQLRALDLEYMRERAEDIGELQRGLLERLRRVRPSLHCKNMSFCNVGECRLGNDHILIAAELSPALVIEMDDRTRGFLVEKGGRSSHAAILANALGLPAVCGVEHLHETVQLDAQILIDGDNGEVIINPSRATLRRYHKIQRSGSTAPIAVDPVSELRVMANIDLPSGVQEALAAAAEGVGLYRTEIEMLAKGRLLTEMEQTARYTEVLEAMKGHPVYVRLLDLGADKAADWLNLPAEDNPALGCRGARLLLAHPDLLWNQARALARAASNRLVHVVYPMIVDVEQFRRLRGLFELAVADLKPGCLLHGVMFEVPSACLQAQQILEAADFGCIGTNDLTQYLFAADRMNENLVGENLFGNPILWEVIENLARTAKELEKPLSICGELAANPRFTRWIIEAGFTTVSVNPKRIAEVRKAAQAL